MTLRRQLPVYSPVSAAAIARAIVHSLGLGLDGEGALSATLERVYAAEHALLFASGTDALQAALQLGMDRVGDASVALPAFTCFDVAAAAVGVRARIRFYDLDPTTLAPDLQSLQHALERGTRVAVITPLYGFPVDWEAVADLLARYGAIPIEDAAQGDHAEWRGRPLGSLGPISVLSFGRGKGWTGGRGGALLVRDQPPWCGLRDRLAESPGGRLQRMSELRVLGILTAQWAFGRPAWYRIPQAIPWLRLGETVYRAPTPPRPMTVTARACLAMQRPAAAREAAARRANAEALLGAIDWEAQVKSIRSLPGARPGYLRLPLRLSRGLAGFDNPAAGTRLGLAPSYPSVLAAIPQVRPWVDDATLIWPGAQELVRTLFTLPTHSRVSGADRAELVKLLRAYAQVR